MEESQKPSPKPGEILICFCKFSCVYSNNFLFSEKVFSYLSIDEIEKMKAEEEKKIATLSRAEISSLSALDHSDDESVESQPTR